MVHLKKTTSIVSRHPTVGNMKQQQERTVQHFFSFVCILVTCCNLCKFIRNLKFILAKRKHYFSLNNMNCGSFKIKLESHEGFQSFCSDCIWFYARYTETIYVYLTFQKLLFYSLLIYLSSFNFILYQISIFFLPYKTFLFYGKCQFFYF